jgi:hypothetical protein
MINQTNIHLLLAAVAWPFVALVAMFVFKRPFYEFMNRVVGFKSSYVELEARKFTSAEVPKGLELNLTRAGSIYWVAADFATTVNRLTAGHTHSSILQALNQVVHHVNQIGADKVPEFGSKLSSVKQRLRNVNPNELGPSVRQEFAQEILDLSGMLGVIIHSRQSDFKARAD